MFRREHLIDIGLYDPDMLWHEERELMYRFKKRYNVFNLPLPLYRYFKHGDNMTCDIPNMRTYEQILNEKPLRFKNVLVLFRYSSRFFNQSFFLELAI